MSPNQNIICVSNTAWNSNFSQSTKQLISLIALQSRILYVDYPFTLKDVLSGLAGNKAIDVKRILGLKKRTRTDITEHDTEVIILSPPPVLPINWITNTGVYNFFNFLNNLIIISCIRRYQKKLGFTDPIIINAWSPIAGMSMIGKFNEKLLIYYCYDEISAAKWVKKHGTMHENNFLQKVDGVIVTSKELQKSKSIINKSCYLVPNGVDFPIFQEEYLKPLIANKHIKFSNYETIVGYVGTINDRVDLKLLEFSMNQMPETLFVFIGRVTDVSMKDALKKHENCHFIPPMNIQKLPEYIKYFTVGIIPFVRNSFTVNIYPMKINEYLAMGKPVVLTEFSDLEEFKDICSFANTKIDFVMALRNEIQNNSHEKISQRIQVAFQNSWQNRAKDFIEIMDKLQAE